MQKLPIYVPGSLKPIPRWQVRFYPEDFIFLLPASVSDYNFFDLAQP
jgi:hypothetical protein